MKRKITALLLLIVMLLSELPVRTAKAAPADTDVVGNTHITYDDNGNELYTIYVENGNLYVQGEYYSDSSALLSYHTAYLYFTTEPTEYHPKTASNAYGGQNYYAVNVKSHTTEPSNRAGYVYDTYVINAQTLDEMAEALFGDRNALKGGGKSVYISEGYVLKERTSTSANWIYKSKELDTIDAIRNAAEWSETTWFNFKYYYDIKLDLNLEPYQVSVSADEGGAASVGKVMDYYGDSVSVKAVATKEDYVFTGWEIKEGDVVLEDALAESTTFLMPESNVSLHATFEYQGGPTVPPTMPPVATPTPKLTTKPGLTPPPTPIPTSTPIPTPTYYPEDTDQIRKHQVRYYTSDAGYTMETIYNENGLLADNTGLEVQGKIKSNTYTKMDASYQLGTDSAGNTWYFIASGSDATYVHPAVYEGNNVNTEEVRNITELTFPETITYRGTDYTVTSIGGGTSMYKTSNSSSTDNSSSSTTIFSDTSSGYYSYWKYLSNENTSRLHEQTYTTDIEYAYGVAGTGFITSEGLREFYWHYYDSGEDIYDTRSYINSYYVHNTTLQYVTIPDTVTQICDYAFYGCQALKKITGGDSITSIGEGAFMASDHLLAKACINGNDLKEESGYSGFVYYYYNGSYTFDECTDVMTRWGETIDLSERMDLAEFPALKTIGKRAFMWRTNLFRVELPSTITSIGTNAFAGCKLESITILGASVTIANGASYEDEDNHSYPYGTAATLGTKGTKETVIITVPNSTAMTYGLDNNSYYTLRCGYQVTYNNNFTPEDTYIATSMLKELYETAVQVIDVKSGVSLILDDDGDLFYQYNGWAYQLMKGTKFLELKTFENSVSSGGSHTVIQCYFAVGKNGELYGTTKNSVTSWTNLGMPKGAHCFQFSGNKCSNSGWIYYLNADGRICVARVNYSNTAVTLVEHEEIFHEYPSADYNYKFDKIVIENEGKDYSGTVANLTLTSSTGIQYSNGAPPQIVAHTASDSSYMSNALVRFAAEPISNTSDIAACYKEPDIITTVSLLNDELWIYKEDESNYGDGCIFGGTSQIYDIYYVEAGGGLNKATYDAYNHKFTKTFKSVYEASDAKREDDWAVIKSSMMGTIVWNVRKDDGKLMFSDTDADIVQTWTVGGYYYANTSYGDNRKVEYDIEYVLDSKNRLYCVYHRYVDGSGSLGFEGKLLVSDVSTVQYLDNGDYEKGFLVLDKTGILWSLGASSSGVFVTRDSYVAGRDNDGERVFSCLITPTQISSSVVFADFYTDTTYLLAQAVDGTVHAAGNSVAVFGDNITHYGKLTKISAIMPEATEDILYGYEFRDVIYKSMFERDGYKLTKWNTKADGTGQDYYPGDEVLLTAALTLYAQWERVYTEIIYAPNGGEGEMEIDIYEPTVTTITLSANQFSKKGHSFSGWSTEPAGAVVYSDKQTVMDLGGTVVLYAQWAEGSYILQVAADEIRVTPVAIKSTKVLKFSESTTAPATLSNKTYTISYEPSPGILTAPLTGANTTANLLFKGWELYRKTTDGYVYALNTFSAGETISHLSEKAGDVMTLFPYWGGDASYVTLPMAKRDGYEFLGWRVNGNNELLSVTERGPSYYKPVTNETLYAYYEPMQYTITFDWNFDWNSSGEGDENTNWTGDTKKVVYDGEYGSLPIPTREGYTFLGWYTEEDETGNGCGEEVTSQTTMEQSYDHTLHARWELAFKGAEVWLTSCAIISRTKAIPAEEELDVEEDVLVLRERGLSSLWIAVRATGRFNYMTIEVPWENEIRTISFDSATYDEETERWELPGFVEYVSYGAPVAFGERVYDPTMYYYEEGDKVLIGFIPHDAGELSRWFEGMLRKDIVLFGLWEDERMAYQPGWTNEIYEIKVNFYGNDKLLQGYKVGVQFVPWKIWNKQIIPARDSTVGGWQ